MCRAARESRAAGSAAGGRPRRGWGCDAGLEPQAGRPLLRPAARKSLRRAPRRKPGHSARSASRLAACAKLRGHRWILSRGWSSSGFPAAQRLVTAALGLESRVRRRARTPGETTPAYAESRTAGQPEEEESPRERPGGPVAGCKLETQGSEISIQII